ncbi:MAG: hypothetical protein H0X62_14210 [Bacteroidetes bacterium]|nr:hypothetical protein [Bacteroidota bacterium]
MILTIINLIFAVILGVNPTTEAPVAVSKFAKTEDAKLLKIAKKQLLVGESEYSREILEYLLKRNPENAEYNYQLGRNIYFTVTKNAKAIPYLETAVQNCKNDTMGDVFYMLGDLYQQQKEYDKAIEAFTNMKRFTKSNAAGRALYAELNTRIAKCKKAKSKAVSTGEIVVR